MSILVADGGATKTAWILISEDEEDDLVIRTSGMNPRLKVDSEIESVIFDELIPQIGSRKISELFFYGSGCRFWADAERMRFLLSEAFNSTDIKILTDIQGAGRAVFGEEEGIVVISGTGSSAGLIRGGWLVDIMSSKAYPEGDFGSGCHIGSLILRDYFTNQCPAEIKDLIDQKRKLDFDELFLQFQDQVKSKQIAAKAMRDIAGANTQTPESKAYVDQTAATSIRMLLNLMLSHFGEPTLNLTPIKFIGSTAVHFESVFRKVFGSANLEIVSVEQSPVKGLISFHKYRMNNF